MRVARRKFWKGKRDPPLGQSSSPYLPKERERETHEVYFLMYTKGVLGLLCAWKVPRSNVYQNQNVGPGEMVQTMVRTGSHGSKS